MSESNRDEITEGEQEQQIPVLSGESPVGDAVAVDTEATTPNSESQTEPQVSAATASVPQEEDAKVNQPSPSRGKTWYPYITKTQFEKFLARLGNKMPEQIDRDYVRALIRTPSMIYRFLRGVEAMRLIDREQIPTERLVRLVDSTQRPFVVAEILSDLYSELLAEWQQANQSLSDDDIVGFFRTKTGMGRDSANKMKMFFKYLLNEADFGEAPEFVPPEKVAAQAEERDTIDDASPSAPAEAPSAPAEPAPAAQAPSSPPAAPTPAPQQTAQAPQQTQQQREPRPQRTQQNQEQQQGGQQRDRQRQDSQRTQGRETQQERRRGRDGNRDNSRNGGQQRNSGGQQQSEAPPLMERGPQTLNEVQRAYLQTLQSIVRVNVDGDWDEDMIKTVFDRLERLFDRIRRG